jgi:mycobactin peptide synthetase MbtE
MADSEQDGGETGLLPLSIEQSSIARPRMLRRYQFPILIKLNGTVDAEVLGRALGIVAGRHEPLRLRLRKTGGAIYQRIEGPPGRVRVPVATPERGCAPEQLTRRLANDPMDLSAEGPLRAILAPRSGGGHDLALVVHHLAWDNWCLDILLGELAATYQAVLAGRRPALPPLRTTWTAHVLEQARAGPAMPTEQLAYWSALVAASSSLPGEDHGAAARRPAELAAPGFTARSASAVAGFARAARVTPAAVWQTMLLLAIARAFDTGDFLYYHMHHGRDRRGSDALIGFFARSIVLRFQADPGAGLADMCRATLLSIAAGVSASRPPFSIRQLAAQLDGGLFRPAGRLSRPISRITINVLPGGRLAGPAAQPDPLASLGQPYFLIRRSRLCFWLRLGPQTRLWAAFDQQAYPVPLIEAIFGQVAELVQDLAVRG